MHLRELKNAHSSKTTQNRTHVESNVFDHKHLEKHLLQQCPQLMNHPVYFKQ